MGINERGCGGEECGGQRWCVGAGGGRERRLGSDWWWLGELGELWRVGGVRGDLVGQVKVT